MPGFLLHLQGPIQSYADTGFGQLREAGLFPSRAAVLGIIAAARGIPRGDEELVRLHDAFKVHVATARPGQVAKDYHTVETDPARSKTLTWRDYHHDAHFVAFVELADRGMPEEEAQTYLEEAMAGLDKPVYTAFLGRRSCPPATPLLPITVTENGMEKLIEITESARSRLPETGERRPRQRADFIDLYLDGYFDEKASEIAAIADVRGKPTHGTRRDKLVAPSRAYVNRPYTYLQITRTAPDVNQRYFDAIPQLASPASE